MTDSVTNSNYYTDLATKALRNPEEIVGRLCTPLPGLRNLYWNLVPVYYNRRIKTDYDLPIDPFKIVMIDPSRVTRNSARTYPPWKDFWNGFGKVMPGDWDRGRPSLNGAPPHHDLAEHIEGSLLYESMREHFVEGVPWEQTEKLQYNFRVLDENPDSTKYGSREEFLRRYRKFDDLYESIKRDSIQSQRERAIECGEHSSFRQATRHEIIVDIARDGEILSARMGTHRLYMAKILGLDSIPVLIQVRHADWIDRLTSEFENQNENTPSCFIESNLLK